MEPAWAPKRLAHEGEQPFRCRIPPTAIVRRWDGVGQGGWQATSVLAQETTGAQSSVRVPDSHVLAPHPAWACDGPLDAERPVGA